MKILKAECIRASFNHKVCWLDPQLLHFSGEFPQTCRAFLLVAPHQARCISPFSFQTLPPAVISRSKHGLPCSTLEIIELSKQFIAVLDKCAKEPSASSKQPKKAETLLGWNICLLWLLLNLTRLCNFFKQGYTQKMPHSSHKPACVCFVELVCGL